ncbi:MAG: glycogen/starch/alpha-glucan phosphorylase [Alphaproteobacteria bacterium]|jgi:starch phosphorylase|uniref:glycogen/starch/alpha-glucan phosphorylase n=1 Tax=Devosia sp. XGJD_8 TaxID=3391187 RepID=UPI001DBBCBB9|nr:glycogen/starch/alpha-glucan phosphorylase [Alphaproteobacteria bacterium]MBU1560017.1 glycogen/starch/alpha-glucan phosphorylase [Alphaproteobacteria bacterium]MBU2302319.1 glycogen/starch/alpha-glucan phosphorylase [Alphaproteobacteria bacterium]MBU2369407.1 glycogen/starch/alpha-glucan phosphorylase [Alphaproteobacteria bacterium]
MPQQPIVYDAPTPEPRATTVEAIQAEILERLIYSVGKDPIVARRHDWLAATILTVRDRVMDRWMESSRETWRTSNKRVYYLSLEFLIGRLMRDAMSNVGLIEPVRDALKNLNVDLGDLINLEPDAALGNGGLGRLAACFLESMSSVKIPAYGYGIRYVHGLFRQEMSEGWQVELPEEWLAHGNPWEFERRESAYEVGFGGHVEPVTDPDGTVRQEWRPNDHVLAVAYDTPIVGWRGARVNTLRLWSAQPIDPILLDKFNSGDHIGALEESSRAEAITRVLYPADSTAAGQELRLRQEFFFSSASLQDIVRRHLQQYGDLGSLPDKVAIQLNDTHPAISICELMRILVDDNGLKWAEAWKLTRGTFGYTNHTLLPEALESWPVALLERLLPRHMQIIYQINADVLTDARNRAKFSDAQVANVSLIDENGGRRVRMGQLAFVGSHSINGVSALHTELMKQTVFSDLHKLYPDRINNKTNGITPRRWLMQCNPGLTKLISERIGPEFLDDIDLLRGLDAHAADPTFQGQFVAVKQANKQRLAQLIKDRLNIVVSPDAMFDVQIKRIHEYKRQLLNIIQAVALYDEIRAHPEREWVPRVKIFAGKAAPGYWNAKLIIKLINDVAKVINHDPAVRGLLKVVFLPNYNVSLAEVIVPAADLSEQISTAGMEASGTGNMKFMANGAITIGTMDGANVEMHKEAGPDNIVIFGLTADEVNEKRAKGEVPRTAIDNSPRLKEALEAISSGVFSPDDPNRYRDLIGGLYDHDWFMVARDFDAYTAAQAEVDAIWKDKKRWNAMAIRNTARCGFFSSDRTIRQYAQDIWGVSTAAK